MQAIPLWMDGVVMTKTATQRKATERQRKRDQGLVPVEVWIRPEHKAKLKQFEIEHQKEGLKDAG